MRKVIFSIDIETSGPLVTEHQIIAIGYATCFANDGQFVANPQRLVISGPYTYDEHTWEGFWSKHPELLEEFAKSRQYIPHWTQFNDWSMIWILWILNMML
jgi:hypothetical protein